MNAKLYTVDSAPRRWTVGGAAAAADGDGDGKADGNDDDDWLAHWGTELKSNLTKKKKRGGRGGGGGQAGWHAVERHID